MIVLVWLTVIFNNTGYFLSILVAQSNSSKRGFSNTLTLTQSHLWTTIPFPLEIYPTIGSPGIGLQQLANLICGLANPSTTTPVSLFVVKIRLFLLICFCNCASGSKFEIPKSLVTTVFALSPPLPTSTYKSSTVKILFLPKCEFLKG